MVVVVWTPRDGGRGIISMRYANDREKRVLDIALDEDDAPELTDEWFAKAKPHIGGKPVSMDEFRTAWAARVARSGRSKSRNPKKAVRLDADVVEHFKAAGPGWQTRINDALRKAAKLPAAPNVPTRRATAAKPAAKKTRRRIARGTTRCALRNCR
jgi:uncharacterized protein (DUF4415 family)